MSQTERQTKTQLVLSGHVACKTSYWDIKVQHSLARICIWTYSSQSAWSLVPCGNLAASWPCPQKGLWVLTCGWSLQIQLSCYCCWTDCCQMGPVSQTRLETTKPKLELQIYTQYYRTTHHKPIRVLFKRYPKKNTSFKYNFHLCKCGTFKLRNARVCLLFHFDPFRTKWIQTTTLTYFLSALPCFIAQTWEFLCRKWKESKGECFSTEQIIKAPLTHLLESHIFTPTELLASLFVANVGNTKYFKIKSYLDL